MREISAVIFQGKPRCGAFFNEEMWLEVFLVADGWDSSHIVYKGSAWQFSVCNNCEVSRTIHRFQTGTGCGKASIAKGDPLAVSSLEKISFHA